MIKEIKIKSKNFSNQLSYYLDSRKGVPKSKLKMVKNILSDVKKNHDTAILKYEKKF